ncbi:hypothetical protein GCM10009554_29350 [Kribbella koreensis]|uniref:DUF4034 domain-containing protein n=1 Tax=Kribbella koreensis TaxID=57909 RepID=A0ABP4AR46_9ACTN
MSPLRRGKAGSVLEIDPCMGDQQAWSLRDALSAQDWPTARAVLVAAEHPDDKAFLLETCGAVPGVQDWIGPLAADDVLAQLVRGCHAVAWAWQARGRYGAEHTGRDRFALFFERLRLAEAYLYNVVVRTPDDVTAWAFLVRTARGLQLPLEDGEFRFAQAIERHPTSLKAHAEWMQTLCNKWSGSHEWMHQFARDGAVRGGDGSMLHALVALAHLEVMIDLKGEKRTQYMAREDVRTDLLTAAGLSIWHPAAEFRPGWPLYLNTFALAFSQSGDLPSAAKVFERLGDNPTEFPWGYLGGDEISSFTKARTTALAAR